MTEGTVITGFCSRRTEIRRCRYENSLRKTLSIDKQWLYSGLKRTKILIFLVDVLPRRDGLSWITSNILLGEKLR